MQSRPLASPALPPAPPAGGSGCIFLIGGSAASAGALAAPACAALAAADAVLHDDDVDPGVLALVPRGTFVEPIKSNNGRPPAKSTALARARKLASEGWRVVWLVSGDTERIPGQFAAADRTIHICTDRCAHEAHAAADGLGPQPLATAFSGLAG